MASDGKQRKIQILVIGTPGAGKTPICHRIRDKYGFTYFYSADIQTIRERMAQFENRDWVLDGYPKTLFEARDLAKVTKVSMVFFLDTPVEDIVERLKTRWVHEASGRVYNTAFGEPRVEGKDDITGEPLVQKNDDTPGYVMARYKNYCTKIGPVLQFYNDQQLLHIIDNTAGFERTWALVDQIIVDYGVKPKPQGEEVDDDDGSISRTTPSPKGQSQQEEAKPSEESEGEKAQSSEESEQEKAQSSEELEPEKAQSSEDENPDEK